VPPTGYGPGSPAADARPGAAAWNAVSGAREGTCVAWPVEPNGGHGPGQGTVGWRVARQGERKKDGAEPWRTPRLLSRRLQGPHLQSHARQPSHRCTKQPLRSNAPLKLLCGAAPEMEIRSNWLPGVV